MQGDIDTSVWAEDVHAYTRMFYARYGAGPPGQTPWRLGRGLKARASGSKAGVQGGGDTDTFMTKAHVEIQDQLKNTSLDLWQQFSSNPIESVDLEVIKKWAVAMRPRSIHDLKPMLMLCQSLLRDVADVYSLRLDDAKAEIEHQAEEHMQNVQAQHQSQAQVCHSCSTVFVEPGTGLVGPVHTTRMCSPCSCVKLLCIWTEKHSAIPREGVFFCIPGVMGRVDTFATIYSLSSNRCSPRYIHSNPIFGHHVVYMSTSGREWRTCYFLTLLLIYGHSSLSRIGSTCEDLCHSIMNQV